MKGDLRINLNRDLVDTIVGLHCVFNDIEKVYQWLRTKNLNFGGATPIRLLQLRRGKQVRDFVELALEQNACERITGPFRPEHLRAVPNDVD